MNQQNNKKLRIGLIGLGHLGTIHLKCMQQVDEIEIVGIYDIDTDLAKNKGITFNVPVFLNLHDLILDCDALDIVTPTTSHFEIAKLCIESGKHIFIEKPMTQLLSEARELCDLIDTTDLMVQIGHVERFNPALLSLRNMSIDPMFMEVHRLSQFNPRGTDVSVVLDLMIHDLDIILSLIPYPVKEIQATGVNIVSESEDICNARLVFENGAVVNITASRISLKNMRKMRVFQEDAYISLDFLEKRSEVVRLHDHDHKNQFMGIETQKGRKFIELMAPESIPNNAIEMELRSFVDSVLTTTPPKVGHHEGKKAIELACQIIDSIQNHKKTVLAYNQNNK